MADNWYHGDGLIANLLMRELLGDDYYNLPPRTPLPVAHYLRLPLRFSHLIYHSSVAIPDSDIQRVTRIYKRFEENDPVLRTKSKINRGGGYFRDSMIQIPYSVSNTMTFYMNGDIDEIRRIFEGLTAIGKKIALGGGLIRSKEYRELETDWSLVRDGIAMREIPVEMCRSYDSRYVMRRAVIFPYWSIENVRQTVVPGGRAELLF
ncbi:MAG: hypothetical protein N3G75_06725 [Methanothrix sp.]|nr:hypothetical protein [Methanothrix sp.]MCX8207510.1 hypothetical protein [Methanothrix sp.]